MRSNNNNYFIYKEQVFNSLAINCNKKIIVMLNTVIIENIEFMEMEGYSWTGENWMSVTEFIASLELK